MRGKLAFVLTGALCLALAGNVAAYNPNGEALPPGSEEVEVFYRALDQDGNPDATGEWVSIGVGNDDQRARSWNSGTAQGSGNQAYWDFNFTSHASVAQWIEWNLGGTRKDWRILRPGEYAADSIAFSIKSNNDVMVFFAGFGDLQYQGDEVPPGTQDTIETWYSYGANFDQADANGWVEAAALNQEPLVIPNSNDLHYGITYKLWQRILVQPSNNSSEYENVGTVRLALTNMKYWVDEETGTFRPGQTNLGAPPEDPYVPPALGSDSDPVI